MKKRKNYLRIIFYCLLIIIIQSCNSCPTFSDSMLKWVPQYKLNDTIKYSNGTDSISFIVRQNDGLNINASQKSRTCDMFESNELESGFKTTVNSSIGFGIDDILVNLGSLTIYFYNTTKETQFIIHNVDKLKSYSDSLYTVSYNNEIIIDNLSYNNVYSIERDTLKNINLNKMPWKILIAEKYNVIQMYITGIKTPYTLLK